MQRHFFSSGLILLVAILGLSCTKELSPNAPILEPEKPILRGVQRLQGYWKVVGGPSLAKSFIADTILSRFVTNEDADYNFRYVFDAQVIFTDSTILAHNGFSLYYYRFNASSDTLFITSDSLYRWSYVAVTDSVPSNSKQWCPIITYDNQTWFSLPSSSHVDGADRYGIYWYFCEQGYQCSILDIRNLSGSIVKTDTFPGVTSIDIAAGYLWTAGSYYVDQRNIQDTSFIRRIDLSSQYSFQQGDQIYHLAVHDSLLVAAIRDYLLCFDLSGQFIKRLPTYDGIFSLDFVGSTLIAGTNLSTISTIDLTTGQAIDSYLVPQGLFGDIVYPIEGIVDLGDHVGAFRDYLGGINLYEFKFPQ